MEYHHLRSMVKETFKMKLKDKTILVTGGAGFIGSNLVEKLLSHNAKVIVLDNFNDYYDPKIKEENIIDFKNHKNFKLIKGGICNTSDLKKCFKEKIDVVVHLAAQAGVRPSIQNPQKYYQTNVIGTLQLLELLKKTPQTQLVFSSSSSVYGNTTQVPFVETNDTNQPVSPYAASKKAAEILCYSYAHLHQIKTTVLRLFTVYGPKGRPDMAPYLFTNAALTGKAINKFGSGETARDYTYVDDIVDGIIRAIKKPVYFEIINLGNSKPVTLNEFIATIEKTTNKKLKTIEKPQPPGDVNITYADIGKAKQILGWQPQTSLDTGLKKLTDWLNK